jgi:hypothetical protein
LALVDDLERGVVVDLCVLELVQGIEVAGLGGAFGVAVLKRDTATYPRAATTTRTITEAPATRPMMAPVE